MSKVALAMGPMSRPTGMIGANWAATVKMNTMAYVAGWIGTFYWYTCWMTEHDPANDRVSNFKIIKKYFINLIK